MSMLTLCVRALACGAHQLESIILAGDFIIVVCLLPSSLFPLDSVSLTLSHSKERARRESSSKGRERGPSVLVYTHRLDGRPWSLLHPAISPQRSK